MSIHARLLRATTALLLCVSAAMIAARPALAAAAPTSLPAGQFTLTADYDQFSALGTALAARLGTATVSDVMENANHSRWAITDSLNLPGYSTGFRFDDEDRNSCTSFPQGITTSRDAVGSPNGGRYDGHQLILVSWYTMRGCGGSTSRSRITLVDWDATHPKRYRKILLVEPTGTTSAPSFTDIPIHAGGVSWYGDHLYVADTVRGMRVFDMTRILKTSTAGTADQIGRQNDTTYYAHNYAYVLPQVGTITAATTSGTALVWSTISLDRADPSIVMAEYTCTSGCTRYPNRAPRAVRFPFAPNLTTFAAGTTATEALRLPWRRLNGVAAHDHRWWFNSSGDKKLYYWTPSRAPSAYNWVTGGESISYWDNGTRPDLLWSLQEPMGHRNVFAVQEAAYDG
ncbi:hypothetical protein [Actinoplanes regularis]|uniref:hypothetical protein n=1 Tax=Actinoplanes regularis TaxID=52697 RepID=UPI0024A58764|nr:hypothetical protein [Actinoplanes regularis]GLW29392.1 hypothetical protein Areg01_23320 [Actinoplanes regularis]